jgi:hypothetical protein
VVFKKYCPIDEDRWETALAAAVAICGEQVALVDENKKYICGVEDEYEEGWVFLPIKEQWGKDVAGYLVVGDTISSIDFAIVVNVVTAILNR